MVITNFSINLLDLSYHNGSCNTYQLRPNPNENNLNINIPVLFQIYSYLLLKYKGHFFLLLVEVMAHLDYCCLLSFSVLRVNINNICNLDSNISQKYNLAPGRTLL